MKYNNNLIGAEEFGIKLIRVKSIDGVTGSVLAPEMLAEANRVLKQIDWKAYRAKYFKR